MACRRRHTWGGSYTDRTKDAQQPRDGRWRSIESAGLGQDYVAQSGDRLPGDLLRGGVVAEDGHEGLQRPGAEGGRVASVARGEVGEEVSHPAANGLRGRVHAEGAHEDGDDPR